MINLSEEDIKDSIKVTVCGQYYSNIGRVKNVTAYELEVELPRKAIPFALQYVQSKLINKALVKLDKTSLGFRTCLIVTELPEYEDAEAAIDEDIESDFAGVDEVIQASIDMRSLPDDMDELHKRSRIKVK